MIVSWLARSTASRSISPHEGHGIFASNALSPSSSAPSNSIRAAASRSLVIGAGRRRATPPRDPGGADEGSGERAVARSLADASALLRDKNRWETSSNPRPSGLSCAPAVPSGSFGSMLFNPTRSEEHTSELQSPCNLVCRLLLEKKNTPYSTTVALSRYLMTEFYTSNGAYSLHSVQNGSTVP